MTDMLLTAIIIVTDFLLPFSVIWGVLWIGRRRPVFTDRRGGNLTLWGAAAVVSFVGALFFVGWYILDPEVNRVAGWLGVSVPAPLVGVLNLIRGFLLVAIWYGFVCFRAIRDLQKRPFKPPNLIVPAYALFLTFKLVMAFVHAVQTG